MLYIAYSKNVYFDATEASIPLLLRFTFAMEPPRPPFEKAPPGPPLNLKLFVRGA